MLQSKGKLSSDSAFSMHEGRGVFAGSICWKRGMSVNETATLHFEIHTHSGIIKSTVIKNILLNGKFYCQGLMFLNDDDDNYM